VDAVRQPDEVDVGPRHHHVLREAAPAVEAGLVLAIAEVLMARPTLAAGAAAATERRRHTLTAAEAGHVATDLAHHTGELVTGHVRERHRGIVTHPGVPVAAAHSGCHHLDDRSVRWRFWIRNGCQDGLRVRRGDEDGV